MTKTLHQKRKVRKSSQRESRSQHSNQAKAIEPRRRFAEISMELIDPDPSQVRTNNALTSDEFEGMCANVVEHGVLQPVLVRPGSSRGRYTLIAGEFRFEAARRAGHVTLPCYVDDAPLDQSVLFLRQLSENLQRQGLPHMDLARTFQWLTLPAKEGGGGLKASELARRLGKSEAFISEHRALLQLAPEDQKKIEAGTLSFERARQKLRQQHARLDSPGQNGEPIARVEGINRSTRGPNSNCNNSATGQQLENGDYVYQDYCGRHHETGLTVLVAGPHDEQPDLQQVIQAVDRHLHFLKLRQQRKGREDRR
jgi:ParB/RepB/Spo0J family partition protein